jgi:hypothetical protein
MSPRKFDRFMVDVHIASNPKLSRLTVPERWCHVAGILSLAALAPVRGHLLIGDDPATAEDIAKRAGVSAAVAKSTVAKLKKVGVLEHNSEFGCDCVHDFDDWNPPPRTDNTARERAQRYRDRKASRDDITRASRRDDRDVTAARNGSVTQTEVEVEEKRTPPLPPQGGRERDVLAYEGELAEFCAEYFPGIPADFIAHQASELRASRVEPTVAALRPLVERWHPTVEAHTT